MHKVTEHGKTKPGTGQQIVHLEEMRECAMYKRYLKVTGNAFERGLAIGEALSMQIHTNYLNQKKYYHVTEGYDYENWERICLRYQDAIMEWAPDVMEEIRGTAEGAGMELKQILAMTTAYEKSFGRNETGDKCTALAAAGDATKDGSVILAQTNDENFTEWLNELDVVIHHVQNDVQTMIYTHPGIPAYMGMNNAGLTVLWTYIDNGRTGDGVPTNVIIRQLLQFSDAASAVDYLKRIPHDIPNHFALGDKSGALYCAECYPNQVFVTKKDDYFVHTNHNVYSGEPERTCSETTFDRYREMKSLAERHYGTIDADTAMDFLKNHENFPRSICVHPSPERPWNKTLASMVFEPCCGRMQIAFGNACEQKIYHFSF